MAARFQPTKAIIQNQGGFGAGLGHLRIKPAAVEPAGFGQGREFTDNAAELLR